MKVLTWIRQFLLGALAIAALVHDVSAQRLTSQKKGLSGADSSFALGDIEHINQFTGRLTLTLDIGQSYEVGPNLALQLQLVGSSSGWEQELVFCNPGGTTSINIPDENDNAGFAWRFSLGKIAFEDDKWKYTTTDGAELGLHTRLHPGHPSSPQPNVFYSNSSTYLRFKVFPNGSAQCEASTVSGLACALLELPDGNVHEFHKFSAEEDDWRLVQMRDPFENTIGVDYPPAGTTWEISDSIGRSHTVHFAGPAGEYKRVSSFDLAAFGGARAVYNLQYANTSIARQDFNAAACPSEPAAVTVQTLTRVVRPDASFYEMAYYTDDALAGDVLSGGIRSLRLPGGGESRWTYQRNVIRSQDREYRQDQPWIVTQGVKTKELALSPGGAAIGVWTYSHEVSTASVPGESHPCHRKTVVRDPLGNEQVHYHTTSLAHRWSFGLPFTRCGSGTYSNTGPFVSARFYDGTETGGTLLRSVYLVYTSDGAAGGGGLDDQEKNSRVTYRETVYHDDDDRRAVTRFEDFALGQYRRVIQGVAWNAADGHTTETAFNPGAGTHVLDPDTGSTAGSTFVLPATSDPWLFTTYTTKTVTAAGATATEELCFDATTGFLERQRILAGASRAGHDLLRVFEQEGSTGRVASEALYGGDDQALTDHVYGSLCDMTLPAQPRYQVEHTYQAGIRATSTLVDPCDGDALVAELDQTIDPNTGLVSSSRDASGVETVYTYDTRSRILSERPDESAWKVYDYQLPSQAQPIRESHLTVRQCVNGSTSCSVNASLSWQRMTFDELGRLVTEHLRVPAATGTTEVQRHLGYNALGWKTSQSSWSSAAHLTLFEDHDPFGRVGTITPPGQPAVELSYQGDRLTTRKTRIMLAGGLADAYTAEIRNARGQLIRLCEDQATAEPCTTLETTFTYDVGDRLTRVCSDRDGDTCGQIRRFVHDHRGFLTQERHPEIGTLQARQPDDPVLTDPDGFTEVDTLADVGNDWIYYTRDARGNVLTESIQGSTDFDLTTTYDAAGRPVRIEEDRNGDPRPLKELFYARANSGTDKRQAKLVLAKRHHYLPDGTTATVSEAFTYAGRDGRLSGKQTRLSTAGEVYAWDLAVSYDHLGNPATVTYPTCRHGGCTAPARTVSSTYTQGRPTAVPGYATGITYQAGGILHRITHTNGVTYTLEIDSATGLQRPHRISTDADIPLNTGIFSYDGAGNVTAMGPLAFTYDRLSRLLSGQVKLGSVIRTQTAAYDVHGNVTSLTTHGSTLATPTDVTSNRLTGGTYDAAGNLTSYTFGSTAYTYDFDAAGAMTGLSTAGETRLFLYNAEDERVGELLCAGPTCSVEDADQTWTLRGPANEVLRIFQRNQGTWSWKQDYVYRGDLLLATETPEGTFHYHLDHLGGPAQITNAAGNEAGRHVFYPYGGEATNPAQNDYTLKFTGHERVVEGAGALDYMHARYCSPVLARFTSVDPSSASQLQTVGQSWNRYAYARGNPIRYRDPNGEVVETAWDVFNIAVGVGELVANIANGDSEGAATSLGGIVLDVVATAVPGAPGGASTAIKSATKAERLRKNAKKGKIFEEKILKLFGMKKNTTRLDVAHGKVQYRVVDGVATAGKKPEQHITYFLEAKNANQVGLSAQIKDFIASAKTAGPENTKIPLVIIVNKHTKISSRLETFIKEGSVVILRVE